ncbi:MAG: hypothetical protein ABSH38_18865 [Verrucomicrobiota bacterium]|jgi:hypothetical protein
MNIWNTALDGLEWFTKHGFLEMLFGFGVLGLIRRAFPRKYEHLHVNVTSGGPVSVPPQSAAQSLQIHLSNAGLVNLYIARAYFCAKQRHWWTLWLWNKPTQLRIHPKSDRIVDKDAFELKFRPGPASPFTEYETLIHPGHPHRESTWLALESPVKQHLIDQRRCGVLYIEYATSDHQGVHKVNV